MNFNRPTFPCPQQNYGCHEFLPSVKPTESIQKYEITNRLCAASLYNTVEALTDCFSSSQIECEIEYCTFAQPCLRLIQEDFNPSCRGYLLTVVDKQKAEFLTFFIYGLYFHADRTACGRVKILEPFMHADRGRDRSSWGQIARRPRDLRSL